MSAPREPRASGKNGLRAAATTLVLAFLLSCAWADEARQMASDSAHAT